MATYCPVAILTACHPYSCLDKTGVKACYVTDKLSTNGFQLFEAANTAWCKVAHLSVLLL
jgi:hypothetical protein